MTRKLKTKVVLRNNMQLVGKASNSVMDSTFRVFAVDVRRTARASLVKAPKKNLSDLNQWEKKQYERYKKRRAYWKRKVARGQAKEIPKSYRQTPRNAYIYDPKMKKMRQLFGGKSGEPGRPPYLHQRRGTQFLKRETYWAAEYKMKGRAKRIKRVVIGPKLVGTKSPDGPRTLRYIEYGRRKGLAGNPWMRLAFADAVPRIPNMIQYSARKVSTRTRASRSRKRKI